MVRCLEGVKSNWIKSDGGWVKNDARDRGAGAELGSGNIGKLVVVSRGVVSPEPSEMTGVNDDIFKGRDRLTKRQSISVVRF